MEEMINVLPELKWITDPALAQKCLSCWKNAMDMGGWELQDLDLIPFTLLIPDCRISLKTHVRAVTQTALASAQILSNFYADEYALDMDTVLAGALLHDIGKLLEYRRDGSKFVKSPCGVLLRHPFTGAGLAMKNNLPDAVVHVIAVHAKEGDDGYRSPEAVIVHHADFMNFEPLRGR